MNTILRHSAVLTHNFTYHINCLETNWIALNLILKIMHSFFKCELISLFKEQFFPLSSGTYLGTKHLQLKFSPVLKSWAHTSNSQFHYWIWAGQKSNTACVWKVKLTLNKQTNFFSASVGLLIKNYAWSEKVYESIQILVMSYKPHLDFSKRSKQGS